LGRATIPTTAIGALLLAIGMLLAGGGPVSADGGPHQLSSGGGSGPLDSDLCATCHRAHTSAGNQTVPSETLCLICHGAAVAGATTNVTDGVLAGTPRSLKGGGFQNARMDTSWTGAATLRPVTSMHGDAGAAGGTMWGSGEIASGSGRSSIQVTCLSCHDPHGTGGYRILRHIPKDSPTADAPNVDPKTDGIVVADEATKVYAVASTQDRYFGEVYANGNAVEQVNLTLWCASCHTRYDRPDPGSGHTDSGDPIHRYSHMTRFATDDPTGCGRCHAPDDPNYPSSSGVGAATDLLGVGAEIAHAPVCQTCHVAHGTAAQMGTASNAIPYPDGTVMTVPNARSSLLRLDNRGVCAGCHSP
jgi:predicted CXXCH cytochrome family protein